MTGTVIIGAGIIGCSTAYYLSEADPERATSIHLIEAAPEPFHCASGLAAGFLASNWFAPSVASLGTLSFQLHKTLADSHQGREKWGYSKSTSTSLNQAASTSGARGDDWLRVGGSRAQTAVEAFGPIGENAPAWLAREKGATVEVISEDGSTALVDPVKLSKFLLSESQSRGVKLHTSAQATSVRTDSDGNIIGVIVSSPGSANTSIDCTRILLASGPWTPSVFRTLFPSSHYRLPITSLAGYSLVLRSPRWVATHADAIESSECHAVFATDSLGFSPEIFSRLGGEIYLAGLNSSSLPLPAPGEQMELRKEQLAKLHDVARRLLGVEGGESDLETLREGLCFRPVTSNGTPIVSRVSDNKLGSGVKTRGAEEDGVFIAAGHGPWGISLSLGTGKVMSEMLQGIKPSADVEGLAL